MRKILAMMMATIIFLSGSDAILPRFSIGMGNHTVALAEDEAQPEEETAEEPEEEEAVEEPEEKEPAKEAEEEKADPAEAPQAEQPEEPTEEIAEEAVAGAVEDVVVFSLVGEIDAQWLARWQKGLEQGVRVEYSMSASEYDELNDTCRIAAFGLKEIRSLREDECEQDLYHQIPSSGRTFTFHEDETDLEGDYVIPEAFLRALAEGEYEVYAVYGGDGEEAVFGDLSVTQPVDAEETEEPETTEAPEAAEAPETAQAPQRSVQISMSSVAGAVEDTGEADEQAESHATVIRVLEATISGFEDQDVALQWQCFDGTTWQDIAGANETEYSFEVTEDNIACQWRLKVTVPEAVAA